MVLKEASQQISKKSSHSQSLLSAIPPHTSSLHFPPYQIYHPNNPCTSIKTDKNLILFPQCTWHCEILSGCKIFRKGDRKIALVHCINRTLLCMWLWRWMEKIFTPSSEQVANRDGAHRRGRLQNYLPIQEGPACLMNKRSWTTSGAKRHKSHSWLFSFLLKPLYSISYQFYSFWLHSTNSVHL